jgi:CMP-N,N'-diacetyllegionaminic acid synthase
VEIKVYALLMSAETVLGLITARGGSKGLPRKNVLQVGGKPLIAWTIEAALNSRVVSRVVLSSDDDEIIKAAKAWGCTVPFRRPEHLASDTATSMDVVLHAIEEVPGFDYVMLLQPTSPLRTSQDIDEAFEILKSEQAPSCVSVTEAEQSPYWMYQLDERAKLQSVLPTGAAPHRRQDLPTVYVLNGAIYVARIDWLREVRSFITNDTTAYIMSKRNSLDIDTDEDFQIFRSRIGAGHA